MTYKNYIFVKNEKNEPFILRRGSFKYGFQIYIINSKEQLAKIPFSSW